MSAAGMARGLGARLSALLIATAALSAVALLQQGAHGVAAGASTVGDRGGAGARDPAGAGRLRFEYAAGARIRGRPALGEGGQVYVASHDGRLHALDGRGRLRWTRALGATAFAGPLLWRQRLHVGTDAGELHVLSTGGQRLRTVRLPGQVERAPAAGPAGLLLCAAGRHLVALGDDYRERWRVSAGAKIFGAPVSDGHVIAFGAQDHRLYLVEPDGAVRAAVDLGFDVDAAPVIDGGGVVYVGTDEGVLHAVGPDGRPRWRVHLGGRLRAPAVLAPDGASVLAVSQGLQPAVHVLDAGSGKQRARWPLGQTDSPEYFLRAGPLLAAGRLYVGAPGQRLLALDATTGERLLSHALGGHMHAPPVAGADGTVYVAADDGVLRAFAGE